VLGIADASAEDAARVLAAGDPMTLWREGLAELDRRVDAALGVWREIVTVMPPIRNVSLRDTLASLGRLKSVYGTRFAAHIVPCDIDYQLSVPVDTQLMGIDYIEAWLAQLLWETRWIARFDVDSCICMLKRVCPDYRGLHVNLYDLLLLHEEELELADARDAHDDRSANGHQGRRASGTEYGSLGREETWPLEPDAATVHAGVPQS